MGLGPDENRNDGVAGPARAWLISTAVFIALAIPLFAGWLIGERAQDNAHEQLLDVAARQAALRLRDFVDTRLAVVDLLRTEWEAGAFPEGHGFVQQSEILQSRFTGFRAINWIDPGGTISIVAPLVGNEAAVDKNVSQRPEVRPTLDAARAAGVPTLTPPLDLYQGPTGLASYSSIDGGDGGFVNGVFEVSALIEDCLRTGLLEHYRIAIHDGDEEFYSSPGSPEPVDATASESFPMGGREWRLEITPRNQFWQSQHHRGHTYGLVIGLALAAGIAVLVRFSLQRRQVVAREREHSAVLEGRLREAEKLEALGRLAGGVAHDFNNALTVILGNLSLLHDEVGEEGRTLLGEIESVADRATDLTAQLLAYAKREVVLPVPLDLAAHVAGLRSMLRRLVREDVALDFTSESGPLVALADPAAVDRILVNLVLNGADAIAGAGSIRVRVLARDTRGAAEPASEVGPGEWIVLAVRDDGAGIRPEDRPHIFEPFYSTKAPEKGTGLGLPSVYGLATQLGGHVTLESRVDVGSTFEIWLPRAEIPARPWDPGAAPPAPTGDPGIVLLVEDDPAVRRMVSTHLRRGGFEVWEAANGEEALSLDLTRPAFAIVDLVMPGVGGADVARRLRSANSDVGVILCSGYAAEPEALHVALEDPRVEFLAKPFTMERLGEALRSVSPRSPAAT